MNALKFKSCRHMLNYTIIRSKKYSIFANYNLLCLIGLLFFFNACTVLHHKKIKEQSSLSHISFSVEEAPEWSALFKRTNGWYGGDGIFFLPTNGKENEPPTDASKNLIIFSDTMLKDSTDDANGMGVMLHNTVALLRGKSPEKDSLSFYWDYDTTQKKKTIFIPNTLSTKPNDYYWLGDGFVNTAQNNTTYIFAYKMRNLDDKDDWSFTLTKTNLIKIPAGSAPPFKDQQQIETPLAINGPGKEDKGSFGSGIFVNTKEAGVLNGDGFVYVYGIKGKQKNVVVARVLPQSFDDFATWHFWDGKEWNTDINQSAIITNKVSDELSITPLPDGRYALVFQLMGMGTSVAMRIGASPVGPFGPVIKLYDCPENKENKNYFAYNAKAHPSISKPGELLISYNVNAFHFREEILKNPFLYRPRFVRLKFTDKP